VSQQEKRGQVYTLDKILFFCYSFRMARPLRIEYPGAFYHITTRGNEKRVIFIDDTDRFGLLSYFATASSRYHAVIHAYCLMDNHYHMLLETPLGNLSQIMHHINGAYTIYFNTKHKRNGHLFQGRYKSIVVQQDVYACELSRYIHLNPLRAGMVNNLAEYNWSSYRYYVGKDRRPEWLHLDFVLAYFGKNLNHAQNEYQKFIGEAVHSGFQNPLKDAVAFTIIGDANFVEQIKEKYLREKTMNRDIPALRMLSRGSLEKIAKLANGEFGNSPFEKKAIIYLCHRYSGRTLKEIGKYFGLSESGISQSSRRFKTAMEKDTQIKESLERIVERLKWSNV